jgi:hypothetical protein
VNFTGTENPYKAQGAQAIGFTLTADPGYEIANVTGTIGTINIIKIAPDKWTFSTSSVTQNISFTATEKKRTYKIFTAQPEHATLLTGLGDLTAVYGDTVTVTATPDPGYAVSGVTAVTAGGQKVTATKSADNTYTFAMPASDVRVASSTYSIPPVGNITVTLPDFTGLVRINKPLPEALPIRITNNGGAAVYIRDIVVNPLFRIVSPGVTQLAPGATTEAWKVSVSGAKSDEMDTFTSPVTVRYSDTENGPLKTAVKTLSYTVGKGTLSNGFIGYVFVPEGSSAGSYDVVLERLNPRSLGIGVSYTPVVASDPDHILGDVPTEKILYNAADKFGVKLAVPVKAGLTAGQEAVIDVIVENTHYEDIVSHIYVRTVEAGKSPVAISATMAGITYNGSPVSAPEVRVTETSNPASELSVSTASLYTSTDGGGYSSALPPTNAGAYKVTLSVSEGN